MRNLETGLGYANTDPALHFNTPEPQPDMRWRGAWIYLLKMQDYQSAQFVRDANAEHTEAQV